MSTGLKFIELANVQCSSGKFFQNFRLSYEVFGDESALNENGILIIHALTGNSQVTGKNGWWNAIVGPNKAIDTQKHPVIAFNVPGNGYDGQLLEEYDELNAEDVADLFSQGLKELHLERLFAVVGGSLGGGITWHLAVQHPNLFKKYIPVATNYQASDWVIGMSKIQKELLKIEKDPVQTARKMAMLFYRTPQSYQAKFERTKVEKGGVYNVDSYLDYQGDKLKGRFALKAYQAMNHIMSSIDISSGGQLDLAISKINAEVHIVAIDSDLLFTAREAKDAHDKLVQAGKNAYYYQVNSIHGHDAFLIENSQLENIFKSIFQKDQKQNESIDKPVVLKFGGKSLANNNIDNVLKIIEKNAVNQKLYIVVSARNSATDQIQSMLESASQNLDYSKEFEELKKYQLKDFEDDTYINEQFEQLKKILGSVKVIGEFSCSIKDKVLAIGELISARYVQLQLDLKGYKAQVSDTRNWLKTDNNHGNAKFLNSSSESGFNKVIAEYKDSDIIIFTGFIGSTLEGKTSTLGRNGSNYTASIIANFSNAKELQNWTHVDGIYTANPSLVENARQIDLISYNEANELANFGTSVLHAKTIIPLLEKGIDLKILNSFKPNSKGTLINSDGAGKGVKAVTLLQDVALISLTGRGLLGTVGIDGRIFGVLMRENISIRNISQASSERGVGFIVDIADADRAVKVLRDEFSEEIKNLDINQISAQKDVDVVSVIGNYLDYFDKVFNALKRNNLEPILFNNSINGNNLSIVISDSSSKKAINVIHSHIFGSEKNLNVAVFGKGLVGGTLINQVLESKNLLLEKRNININIFAVADSKNILLNKNGIGKTWYDSLAKEGEAYTMETLFEYAQLHNLENLVCVDATASKDFVVNYNPLVSNGFDLVSANKIANTLGYDFYNELRDNLKHNRKRYLYETNVGAGLPLVDTISQLHHSGDQINKIRGVFSGSLSYIFNNYSVSDKKFSEILLEAKDRGYTEPDPREDLSGNDVGRKLLILAREIDLKNEFSDIKINNLIPESLRESSSDEFFDKLSLLDEKFSAVKSELSEDQVLRYVGELDSKGNLTVDLVKVPKNSSLGQIKGADSIFEIFTDSYGDNPLVVQGAGAGADVTARGVYGDLLKLI
jgi:bifunctional aspartokinase / homoserine dehydrogenase 1